jgi:LytS/YehU family sensor histidine kinase
VNKVLKRYLTLVVWLTLAGFAMTLIWYSPWEKDLNTYLKVGLITATLWNVMWLGNDWLAHSLSKWISWEAEPIKRFVVGVTATLVFTVAAVWMVAGMYYVVLGLDITGDILSFLITSLVITVVISLFMHSRSFLYSWREAAVTAAHLQKETIKSQYESLRNQVNPHFLFNSLNALTNLVYEDQDKAAKFIKQLSDVYRYVLDTRDRELVSLDEELKFLNSYLFLQQIRFGKKLKVDINLSGDLKVAPLVLQMLIENAIKHNVISDDDPLTIRLFQENGWLVVENNRRHKRTLPEESTGVGLANIRSRYTYFSDKPVVVISEEARFVVKLPIVKADLTRSGGHQ